MVFSEGVGGGNGHWHGGDGGGWPRLAFWMFAVLCFKLCTYQRRRRKPESVILTNNIIGWRNNWKTATSHYATCGHSVVVESCAACRLQTEVFAGLQTSRVLKDTQIWAFTVREIILGCFPHNLSYSNMMIMTWKVHCATDCFYQVSRKHRGHSSVLK